MSPVVFMGDVAATLSELQILHDQYSAEYAAIDLQYQNNDPKKIEELHRYTDLQSRIFSLESEVIVQCALGRA